VCLAAQDVRRKEAHLILGEDQDWHDRIESKNEDLPIFYTKWPNEKMLH
jgi:hypothetical protein